jgi:hypothetical protein
MKLKCPQCGSNNQIDIPDTFAKCQSCGSAIYIDIDEITVVYSFTPAINANNLNMHLKRDFEKIGFNEEVEIADALPVFFPFWQVEGSHTLERACSHFPEDNIKLPPGEKIFFDSADANGKKIEIYSIDAQPEQDQKRNLYYVPFFQVTVLFNRKKYSFFINAVSGEVNGDPIPYISSEKALKLFPLFITIFLVFLAFNAVFDNMLVVMSLCLTAMFLFYHITVYFLEKEYHKK